MNHASVFNIFFLYVGIRSRNYLSVSHENVNGVVGRYMNHVPCEVQQQKCGDLHGNFNCSSPAVEPKTGIEFPTLLDNIFGGSNSSLNTEVEYLN